MRALLLLLLSFGAMGYERYPSIFGGDYLFDDSIRENDQGFTVYEVEEEEDPCITIEVTRDYEICYTEDDIIITHYLEE
jgi:hypothetical protein